MEHSMTETRHLIRKNEDWLAQNKDRRNTVYYMMVENSLSQLKQHLEFLEKFAWSEV